MSSDAKVLRYEPIQRMAREEAQQQLLLGGISAARAIYSIALHDLEDAFAETACLEALASEDSELRSAAVGAIGEMTVYAGRTIDFELAESRLLALRESHPELAGRMQDAIDDFEFASSKGTKTGEVDQ